MFGGIRVKNILYIFLEPSVIGKYGEKDVAGCQKGPKKLLLKQ
jgi:hypothetical protein